MFQEFGEPLQCMYTFVICSYLDVRDVMEDFHVHTFFYNVKKKFQDKELENFAKNLENCRRRMLLASIGGSVQSENEYGCCDVCSPDLLFDERLDVLQLSTVSKRKRRRAVRNVGDDLKQKLISVREEVYKERSSFSIVGIRFLCPDSTINNLCKEAK